jgi:ferredoxin-like protein FixX
MKKIYSRLVSMNQYLADEQSPKIMKTKQNIAKAIDLFAVIGANPESYTEKIDDIIISYYKFLEAAYRRVKAFYKSEAQRVGGYPFEKNEEQKNDKGTEVTI